jgi:O-antigen/teichoic acid export membrane protein
VAPSAAKNEDGDGRCAIPRKVPILTGSAQAKRKADVPPCDAERTMMFFQRLRHADRLRLDLVENFAGVGWTALVQVACIPLYIRFLGIAAYGLTGFYLALTAMLQVLDLGLSPTMNREMARYSVQPQKAGEARDLVRTLEAGYWLIGLVIGTAILAAARLIATDWIKAGSFQLHSVQQAVVIMAILAFFQWPISFYQGGLIGLGQQVL